MSGGGKGIGRFSVNGRPVQLSGSTGEENGNSSVSAFAASTLVVADGGRNHFETLFAGLSAQFGSGTAASPASPSVASPSGPGAFNAQKVLFESLIPAATAAAATPTAVGAVKLDSIAAAFFEPSLVALPIILDMNGQVFDEIKNRLITKVSPVNQIYVRYLNDFKYDPSTAVKQVICYPAYSKVSCQNGHNQSGDISLWITRADGSYTRFISDAPSHVAYANSSLLKIFGNYAEDVLLAMHVKLLCILNMCSNKTLAKRSSMLDEKTQRLGSREQTDTLNLLEMVFDAPSASVTTTCDGNYLVTVTGDSNVLVQHGQTAQFFLSVGAQVGLRYAEKIAFLTELDNFYGDKSNHTITTTQQLKAIEEIGAKYALVRKDLTSIDGPDSLRNIVIAKSIDNAPVTLTLVTDGLTDNPALLSYFIENPMNPEEALPIIQEYMNNICWRIRNDKCLVAPVLTVAAYNTHKDEFKSQCPIFYDPETHTLNLYFGQKVTQLQWRNASSCIISQPVNDDDSTVGGDSSSICIISNTDITAIMRGHYKLDDVGCLPPSNHAPRS